MDPVIKLHVRRRVKEKNNSNKDDVSEDEEFERNLEMYVNKTLTTLKNKNVI